MENKHRNLSGRVTNPAYSDMRKLTDLKALLELGNWKSVESGKNLFIIKPVFGNALQGMTINVL